VGTQGWCEGSSEPRRILETTLITNRAGRALGTAIVEKHPLQQRATEPRNSRDCLIEPPLQVVIRKTPRQFVRVLA
jgi:hypothetical protein